MSPDLHSFDAVFLDAYGVLVDKAGALPGAVDFLRHLADQGTPYCVLTNSASRPPGAMSEEFRGYGLAIEADQIITSGMVLRSTLSARGESGRSGWVLGTEQSARFAAEGGVRVTRPGEGGEPDVIVVADQAGFPLLDWMNEAISAVIRAMDAGRPIELILCNPDLIYPREAGLYGLTGGSLAALMETVFSERYGPDAPRFERLGKPYTPIFDAGRALTGAAKPLMIGDQLTTDIAGAVAAGIDSVLVESSVTQR
ncbi:MAG: HAD-IIA family hydrolase, partial [Gammaproteobacteria bacterium]